MPQPVKYMESAFFHNSNRIAIDELKEKEELLEKVELRQEKYLNNI